MSKLSKKQSFIIVVEELFKTLDLTIYFGENSEQLKIIQDALEYFESLKFIKESKSQPITENGKNIIVFMQNNIAQMNNLFKAKDIAEGLFTSSRTISGAMRKLVTDGYVDKFGESPITYSLTEQGKTFS